MAPYKGPSSSRIIARGRTSWSASASTSLATSSRSPAFRRRRQHTIELIDEMKRQGAKLIVVEPYFDLKTPQAIANQVGGKVLVLAPSVGGTKEATDYIQLFEYDVNQLAGALKQVTGK